MATAAEKRIIIEKGADYVINIQVLDSAGVPKDLSVGTWTITMKLYAKNDPINTLPVTATGVLIGTGSTGEFKITIDKSAVDGTGSLDPLPAGMTDPILAENPFATSYNYFYTIDINETTGTSEDIRVLRGKAAVRI